MAPRTKKTVNARRAVVFEASGMIFEQLFVLPGYLERTVQQAQVAVAPDAFALAFGKFKFLEVDAQEHHATGLSSPFPKIATKHQICPITPAIFAKTVENQRMERLHADVSFNLLRIERDVLEYG